MRSKSRKINPPLSLPGGLFILSTFEGGFCERGIVYLVAKCIETDQGYCYLLCVLDQGDDCLNMDVQAPVVGGHAAKQQKQI